MPSSNANDIPTVPPERLSERRIERQRRILEATRRLVIERGARNVTMREIAQLSGVTEKTLFNNFGSKDRLVAAATVEKSAEVIASACAVRSERPWSMLLAIADAIGNAVLEEPELARSSVPLLVDPSSGIRVDAIYQARVAPEIARMISAGNLVPDSPEQGLLTLIRLGMITGILGWCALDVPDDRLVDHLRWQIATILLPWADSDFLEECRAAAMRWTLN